MFHRYGGHLDIRGTQESCTRGVSFPVAHDVVGRDKGSDHTYVDGRSATVSLILQQSNAMTTFLSPCPVSRHLATLITANLLLTGFACMTCLVTMMSCGLLCRRTTIAQIRVHPWVVAEGYKTPDSAEPMDEEFPDLTFDDLPPMDSAGSNGADAFVYDSADDDTYAEDGFF